MLSLHSSYKQTRKSTTDYRFNPRTIVTVPQIWQRMRVVFILYEAMNTVDARLRALILRGFFRLH